VRERGWLVPEELPERRHPGSEKRIDLVVVRTDPDAVEEYE
jgi:hypothetical protein